MKNQKIFTFALAAMFVVGAFAITLGSDDSEAVTAGSMNIYVYDGEEWTDYTNLSGYNALQALQASAATFTPASHTEGSLSFLSTDYIIQKSNSWGSYDEINSNYGDIYSIGDYEETDTDKWETYYYNGSSWVAGPDAIGFIVPFSDGAISSANVVLYYNTGDDGDTVSEEIGSHISTASLRSVINVKSADVKADYMMEFNIKITASGYTPTIASGTVVEYKNGTAWSSKTLEVSDLTAGITVRGYGSNAYAALKDAIGAGNVTGTDAYGSYYGWVNTIFGLGTVTGTNYIYWIQNTSGNVYLSFNMGAYSTLGNVPTDYIGTNETTGTLYDMVCSGYKLEYALYVYS